MRRYPRLVSHVICFSNGYASPTLAARILKDAKEGKQNYCEWIWSCYRCDPRPAVQGAIRYRHSHRGFMADFDMAYALVRRAIETGEEPMFGSWF
jgi:hypothetical protein